MSGFFTPGEKKDRPGIYKRRLNVGATETAGARAGIAAAVVTGDWGELNKAVILDASSDISKYIGSDTGTGYKVISEIIRGGVQSVVVVRVGTGGTAATVNLVDTATTAADVVSVTAKCPGTMPLSVGIRTNLTDPTLKDVTIYNGTKVLETRTITAGTAEVDGVVAAFSDSEYVTVAKVAAGTGTLKEVSQSALTGGVQPTVNNAAYSAGFDAANTELFDVICVDTNDTDVHALLSAYIKRIFEGGDYGMAVIGEPGTVTLDNRITNAGAFDDEKIIYVLGGWNDASGNAYEGYVAAARIGGMVAAVPSNDSLTHASIDGAVSLTDAMTNAQIIKAIKAGCLVISRSKTGSIVIEKAINTLTTIDAEKDAGWKKIRRTKIRFEMMNRIEITLDGYIGSVNNDVDGRAAIIAAGQSVLDAMIGEGKILPGATFAEDKNNPPEGDSAWFVIQSDDIDSFETGYLTFRFRFAPETE